MKKKVLLKSYFVTLKLNSILVNQSFVIGQYFQGYLFSFSLVITNKVAMNCKFPKKKVKIQNVLSLPGWPTIHLWVYKMLIKKSPILPIRIKTFKILKPSLSTKVNPKKHQIL